MTDKKSSRVDMVLATLAGGIYRQWYWAHYTNAASQDVLREQWWPVCQRFHRFEIRDGLERWANQFGRNIPPTPDAFADFIRPKATPKGKEFFSQVKQFLNH